VPTKKSKTSSKKKISVPFNEILKGVTIVMSGYQNPLRGTIRDKALEMGAKYKPDWDSTSTHLICAFSNTPKFTQVLGKGKIVTKRWIEDCHLEKRRQPWRDYRLDDGSEGSDSDDDDGGEGKQKKEGDGGGSSNGISARNDHYSINKKTKNENGHVISRNGGTTSISTSDARAENAEDDDDDEYGGSTDVDSDEEEPSRRPGAGLDDDPDTEDELEKIRERSNGFPKPKPAKEDEAALPPLPVLPDFFGGKRFLLFGQFDPASRKLMNRYIIAYGGCISEYMSSSVDFVITSATWDSNFDDAIAENPDLHFVRPKWIKACHQRLKLVPYQAYIIAPPIDDDDDD